MLAIGNIFRDKCGFEAWSFRCAEVPRIENERKRIGTAEEVSGVDCCQRRQAPVAEARSGCGGKQTTN